jgi:hypothetical protein
MRYFFTITIGLGLISACQENVDNHTPDGALRQFAVFLSKGDTLSFYQALSLKTHQSLDQLTKEITQVEVAINRFPSKYRVWAKKKGSWSTFIRTKRKHPRPLFSIN